MDFIVDAHYLTFKNAIFDGVSIQAVLDHVVDPSLVVTEIHRVLRPDGIVYSETPFIQQVHEGAHDFQRNTALGYRYLFSIFDVMKIGGNGGWAGLVLAWSLRYFFWTIFRNKSIAILLSASLYPILKFFNRFTAERAMFDSSSGVYFLGKREMQKLGIQI